MVDPQARLVVASPYGPGQASYRERIHAWRVRLGLAVDEHCYFGTSGTAASLGPAGATRAIAAELGLRRLRARGSRSLLVHREASPFSTGKLEADLLSAADRSAYDVDDALYADWGGESLLRRVFAKASKASACVERATITVVGNDTLADWATSLSDEVRMIPTCVEPDDYVTRTRYEVHDPPRVVWLGSPSTTPYLDLIAEPLQRLHRDLGAELTVIGGRLGHSALAEITTVIPWSAEAQRHGLADADVGVMPLAPGPLERGKCGYKLLQYAAAGLPAVASGVGVNATMIRRFDQPVVDSADDWYEALRTILSESPTQRRARATRALEGVIADYSFAAWEPAWRALMADLGVPTAPVPRPS